MKLSTHLRLHYLALLVLLSGLIYSLYHELYLLAIFNGVVFVILFLRAGNLRLVKRELKEE